MDGEQVGGVPMQEDVYVLFAALIDFRMSDLGIFQYNPRCVNATLTN